MNTKRPATKPLLPANFTSPRTPQEASTLLQHYIKVQKIQSGSSKNAMAPFYNFLLGEEARALPRLQQGLALELETYHVQALQSLEIPRGEHLGEAPMEEAARHALSAAMAFALQVQEHPKRLLQVLLELQHPWGPVTVLQRAANMRDGALVLRTLTRLRELFAPLLGSELTDAQRSARLKLLPRTPGNLEHAQDGGSFVAFLAGALGSSLTAPDPEWAGRTWPLGLEMLPLLHHSVYHILGENMRKKDEKLRTLEGALNPLAELQRGTMWHTRPVKVLAMVRKALQNPPTEASVSLGVLL